MRGRYEHQLCLILDRAQILSHIIVEIIHLVLDKVVFHRSRIVICVSCGISVTARKGYLGNARVYQRLYQHSHRVVLEFRALVDERAVVELELKLARGHFGDVGGRDNSVSLP